MEMCVLLKYANHNDNINHEQREMCLLLKRIYQTHSSERGTGLNSRVFSCALVSLNTRQRQ